MGVINLAEYSYRLTLDSSEYTNNMQAADVQAEGMKSRLSGIGGFLKTTLVAGMVAAGAAVIALGKNAIEAYSEYEQLVGGVETLFKDSAGIVNEYAANAYKTAGMSANTYMETVTSFSASFLQSLGGDTKAAAKVADMAITDMSDNANKMGSSIESIQYAYQGFAKQNYTMLDNLKLGYGGTKEEMQRLLSDAEKLSGVKYDMSNLNDVYEAIHVVQTELGITGTTAKEASTTIQGSASSMKAAWSNLLVGIADEDQNFDALLGNLVDSIGTFAGNLLPRIKVVLDGVVKLMIAIVPQIASNLLPQIAEIATSMGQSLINGLANSFPQLADTFTAVQGVIQSVITTIQTIIDLFVTAFTVIWEKWGADIVAFAQTYFDNIMTVIQTALDLIQGIAQLFIDLFTGNWKAVFEDIKNIASTAWDLVKAIFQTAVDNVAGIIKLGFTVMGTIASDLMNALWTGIQNVWASIVGWFSEAVNGDKGLVAWFAGLGETFTNIGSSLLNWVWDGLKSVWESISTWISEKVEWLADKLAFWRKSTEEMSRGSGLGGSRGGGITINGSHANGLSYVPFDGYTALLHKGERVLTAKENAVYSSAYNQSNPTFTFQGGNVTINGNADQSTVNKIRSVWREEMSSFINQFGQHVITHR